MRGGIRTSGQNAPSNLRFARFMLREVVDLQVRLRLDRELALCRLRGIFAERPTRLDSDFMSCDGLDVPGTQFQL